MTARRRIALLGLGEVGGLLGSTLAGQGFMLKVYDPLLGTLETAPARRLLACPELRATVTARSAVANCGIVISAVTATRCVAAAKQACSGLMPGAWFVDLNSVAPETRREAAGVVEASGGRYVEAAVMAPYPVLEMDSPILVGGRHAAEFIPVARSIGFSSVSVCSPELGRASAIKLCRSIIVKGMEALVTEALLTGHHFDVEREVLESLVDHLPHPDWSAFACYLMSRTLQHGKRRAEEIDEAARLVREAGLQPWMCIGTAGLQAWAGGRTGADTAQNLDAMLDAVRRSLEGALSGEETA